MATTTTTVAVSIDSLSPPDDSRLLWVNGSLSNTTTTLTLDDNDDDYIYDRIEVQVIFIALYTIVFCSCFVGNALVILVVTLHWRMRSITNYCLANLAIADFSVGIFCVYQNLSLILIDSWIFGDTGCKLYHFVNSLSHTASILILVVICIERYLAIIHPIRCKQMLTLHRLRLTIACVWILSGLYSSPRLYYINTVTITRHDGETEILCIPTRTLYDSVTFDLISMILLFIIPLLVLSVLYTRIGIALWRSSQNRMPTSSASESSSSSYMEPQKFSCSLSSQQNPHSQCQHHKHEKSTLRFPCCLSIPCSKCCKYFRRLCRGRSGHKHNRRSSHYRKNHCHGHGRGGDVCTSNGLRHDHHENLSNTPTPCSNDICNHCYQTIQLQLIQGTHHREGESHYTNYAGRSNSISNASFKNLNSGHGENGGGGRTPCSTTSLMTCNSNAPSSPYSLKERRNLSHNNGNNVPPTKLVIKSEDPIVVVKFEKNSSFKRNSKKRGRCTILMNSSPNFSSSLDSTTTMSSLKNEDGTSCTNEGGNQLSNGSHHHHPPPPHHPPFLQPHSNHYTSSLECSTPCSCSTCCPDTVSLSESTTKCCGCRKKDVVLMPNGHTQCSLLLSEQQKNFEGSSPCAGSNSVNFYDGSCPNTPITIESGGGGGGPMTPPVCKLKRLRVIRSSKYGTKALQSRRRIIKMLVVVVVAFGICNLPFHARKMWQNWSNSYEGGSTFSSLLTPLTFLIMYSNSAVSPLVYFFMSTTFRASLRDLLNCNMRRSLKVSRRTSARSTHINPVSTAA